MICFIVAHVAVVCYAVVLLKFVLSSCCLVLMLLLFLMVLVALLLHLLLLLRFIPGDWANQLPCAEGRPLRGRPSAASSLAT